MNSKLGCFVMESLNPTISFQVGDANRIPVISISDSDLIFARLEQAFNVCFR